MILPFISKKQMQSIFIKPNKMKNKIITMLFSLVLLNCKAQENINSEIIEVRKEISKASLRKFAFFECLNKSTNDSLKTKINDSSGDNLYYNLYGFDPLSNPEQRVFIDSLSTFAETWGKQPYPNIDHPNTKMHITNCLNMYESYELEKLIEGIFNNSVDEEIIRNNDISDLKDESSIGQYKYYKMHIKKE
jgi:hypothetical protein